MTTTIDQIHGLYRVRLAAQDPDIRRMMRIRDAVNGDIVLPLPELDTHEAPAIANLVSKAMEGHSQRVASVLPNQYWAPLKAGQDRSEAKARVRRLAAMSWWDANRMRLKLRRRARHLSTYAATPNLIRPGADGRPIWFTRNPLTAFPAPKADPDNPAVENIIFKIDRTWSWLRDAYPDRTAALSRPRDCPLDKKFTLLEYNDGTETVLMVIGEPESAANQWEGEKWAGARYVELERTANRADRCLATHPGRISLDKMLGQFDGMLPLYESESKLMSLGLIAMQRGIFPETWMVSDGNGEIVVQADAQQGIIGEIRGAQLTEIRTDPGFATTQWIDRLERQMRIEGTLPAEFGGESTSNIRTGRRGDSVLSAAVDFPMQENQDILASTLEEENRIAVAVFKGWNGKSKSFSFAASKTNPGGDYTPADFEIDTNVVKYAMSGTDVDRLVIGAGQRVGMGTMSKRGFMELDPMIEDSEFESDRIVAEGLEAALLASIQQQGNAGEIPPADLARIAQLVLENKKNLAGAVQQAQEEAQKRQAQEVPAADPMAQPGLAMPGMGAEAPAAIPEQGPSMDNLTSILNGLRRPQGVQV